MMVIGRKFGNGKKKLCLVCSAGGHLVEMERLKPCYQGFERFFITFKRIDTTGLADGEKVYFITDPAHNPVNLVMSFFQSLSVLLKERPDVLISTGGGIAVPASYIAKLLGVMVVYVESFCRIEEPSLSGKFLYPVADLFLVQWPEMVKRYGTRAKYWGAVV
jgi:beta-1,4-N-acetylglucosaminyltransferase